MAGLSVVSAPQYQGSLSVSNGPSYSGTLGVSNGNGSGFQGFNIGGGGLNQSGTSGIPLTAASHQTRANNSPLANPTGNANSNSMTPAGMQDFLAAENLGIGQLNNQLGGINAMQNQTIGDITGQYTPQFTSLADQLSQGNKNLDQSQYNLNLQRTTSLNQLANQLRGMLNQYNVQLANEGAGNSEAAGLLRSMLSQEGNYNRNQIASQFGIQQQGIDNARDALTKNYQDQMAQLQANKQAAINGIINSYTTQKANIDNEINNARTDETRTALYMQDQAAANQALAQLQSTVSGYSNLQTSLEQQYSQAIPKADLSAYTQAYSVQPFATTDLAPISMPSTTGGGSAAPVSAVQNPTNNPAVGTIASLNS